MEQIMSDKGFSLQRRHSSIITHRGGSHKAWGGSNLINNQVSNQHSTNHDLEQGHDRQENGHRGKKRNCFNNKKQTSKNSGISDLKEIGLWYGGSLVMNTIVGLGIFGTPKGVLLEVGSVGMTLLIWTFTGIFSMFAALCFVELRESVRKEGVEYAYITEAFGPLAGFVYSWMRIAAAEPAATALFSMVFTNYLTDSIYDGCGPPESLVEMLSILAILSMCLVNVMSTKLSQRLQHLATVGKTCVLVTIVIIGIQRLGNGKLEIINQGMKGTKLSQSNLVFACYNGLWAYGGWSQVNHVTSGIKKPPRNVPRLVKTVIPLVLLLYLTVVLSYFTAMTQDDLLSSRAIGVTWAERVLGPAKPIVTIGVCLTALGSLNATFLSAGRLSGVAARNGQMPHVASWVHVRSKTPLLVVTLKAVVAMAVVCLASVQECLRFYIFCVWLFHGMSIVALLVLRYKNKHKLRPYKADLWVPVVVIVVIVYLLLIPFTQSLSLPVDLWIPVVVVVVIVYLLLIPFTTQSPGPEFIAVVILLFLSLVSYYPVEWLKTRSVIHFPDQLTIWLQLFLRIAPKRELRRERRRSMIRRFLALDSILHPENNDDDDNNKTPTPVISNQFTSLRYPRNSYVLSRGWGSSSSSNGGSSSGVNGRGRQEASGGRENPSNLLRRRRGNSLRATDLKLLNSNSWWTNNNNNNNINNNNNNNASASSGTEPSVSEGTRRKRPNRESHSFNGSDVANTNLPSRPSLPILKNRFNTTPRATRDSEPGALASPSEMIYSQEVPPSFVYRSHRYAFKSGTSNRNSNGTRSHGSTLTDFEHSSGSSANNSILSEVSSENIGVVLQPKALPRYRTQQLPVDVHHHYNLTNNDNTNSNNNGGTKNLHGSRHDRHVFFNNMNTDNDSNSSSDDDDDVDDDKTQNESFAGLEHTIFSSFFEFGSSSESSTDDEEEEDEEEDSRTSTPSKNNYRDEYQYNYFNSDRPYHGYTTPPSYNMSNIQEQYKSYNNNNTVPYQHIRRRNNRDYTSFAAPVPRKRASLLRQEHATKPQPAPRRPMRVGGVQAQSFPLPQPVPPPRHRHRHRRQTPVLCDYDQMDVSYV